MDSGWRIVLTTNNVMEAEVVAGRLKAVGLKARTHKEPAGQALGFTVGLLGEVQVLVSDVDYGAAMAMLGDELHGKDLEAKEAEANEE